MIPVTLVYLPGANYLLGTFDTADFSDWWISEGFAGVDYVVKGVQTYGEIHLAICKMINGTWSIFQSKNYAQTWTEVYNTSYEIFDIVRINFGWTIINCGDGFYESVNAGTDWSLVCGLPTAPIASAIANIGGGDVLICTDGRYIWRSTDYARNWTAVRVYEHYTEEHEGVPPVYHDDGDMQHIHHGNDDPDTGYWPMGPQYTGPSVACVAGACGKVVVGHGPYGAWSVDGGVTFGSYWPWDYYWDTDDTIIYDAETGAEHCCFPPGQYVGRHRDDIIITQIVVSSVEGPTADDVMFLIKADDRNAFTHGAELEDARFSRIYRTFSGLTKGGDPYYNHWLKYVFCQQLAAGETGPQLATYELLQAGADSVDRLVFIAQSKYDSALGKYIPSMRYSIDGGVTWTVLDVSTFTTDQGELPEGGGPFLDDDFAKLVWVTGFCNNGGYWDYSTGGMTRNMSYDMDWLESEGEDKTVTYDAGAYVEGTDTAIYRIRSRIEATHTKTADFDSIITANHNGTYTADGLLEKVIKVVYRAKGWISGPDSSNYQMGALVYSSSFPLINMPQAFRLEFPWVAERGYPYDSREA